MRKQPPKHLGLIMLAMIIIATIILTFFSCNTTKKATEQSSTDSSYKKEARVQYAKYESEIENLKSKIKELEAGATFFDQQCNDSVLASIIDALQNEQVDCSKSRDSILKKLLSIKTTSINEATIKPDGTIVLRGAIRTLNQRIKEQSDSLNKSKQSAMRNDSLMNVVAELKKTTKTEKVTVVKASLFGRLWWILLIVGLVAGFLIRGKLKSFTR